jgi:hemoglobin
MLFMGRKEGPMQAEHSISGPEIEQLVDRFYAKVRLDPEIGPVFNAAIDDWPAHLSLLKDFWSTVLLPERRYKGNPLAKHLELSLDPAHFARWLELFAETAREVMPPKHAEFVIAKSQRIAETFQSAIAQKRGETTVVPIFRAPIAAKH